MLTSSGHSKRWGIISVLFAASIGMESTRPFALSPPLLAVPRLLSSRDTSDIRGKMDIRSGASKSMNRVRYCFRSKEYSRRHIKDAFSEKIDILI